jgi:osmotically inducible protein OsmC
MGDSKASVKWTGSLKEGKGHISTESGALKEQPYGFNTRFEDAPGTNPEELIAAAHASCFTMALSKELAENGIDPQTLNTDAVVTLDKKDGGFAVTKSKLVFNANLNGADEESFRKALQSAKENCPISKLLDTEIELEITLNEKANAA